MRRNPFAWLTTVYGANVLIDTSIALMALSLLCFYLYFTPQSPLAHVSQAPHATPTVAPVLTPTMTPVVVTFQEP